MMDVMRTVGVAIINRYIWRLQLLRERERERERAR